MSGSSDEFSGRLGLIFATIGAAIGTGNIWRFPRMVGANGGGSFLVPWLIFLFLWSIPWSSPSSPWARGPGPARWGPSASSTALSSRGWASGPHGSRQRSGSTTPCHRVVHQLLPDCTQGRARIRRGHHGGVEQLPQAPGEVVMFQALAVVITMAAIWKGRRRSRRSM